LVKNPDVFLLFWGSPWNTDAEQMAAKSALVSMFQNIGTSDFACAWREYGVPGFPLGPGTYHGSYVITTASPSPLDDATIQQKIQDEIAAGHAPSRTDDRVYVMIPAKGVAVAAGDGSTGCGGSNFVFCGYHDSFGTTGAAFRYAVLPYPCETIQGTCFVDPTNDPGMAFQVVGSHELTELVTDPDSPPIDSGGWFTAGPGNEDADICAADNCVDTVTAGGQTFSVNPGWSNLGRGCISGVSCSAPPLECTDTGPGICVTGIGTSNLCEFEWLADPNLTLVAKTQLPGRTVACADGQPFCDADDTTDGQCTFNVAGCLNAQDPRVACSPATITSLTLTSPQPSGADPVNNENVATLLNALKDADSGSSGVVAGNQITYSPAASTPNSCTNYLPIVVPAGAERRIAVTLHTAAGLAHNRLTLRCAPAVP